MRNQRKNSCLLHSLGHFTPNERTQGAKEPRFCVRTSFGVKTQKLCFNACVLTRFLRTDETTGPFAQYPNTINLLFNPPCFTPQISLSAVLLCTRNSNFGLFELFYLVYSFGSGVAHASQEIIALFFRVFVPRLQFVADLKKSSRHDSFVKRSRDFCFLTPRPHRARSSAKKWKIFHCLHCATAAASCVNTLLGNSCFYFSCCVTQTLRCVTRCITRAV